jgi:hypothetical protein
VLHGMKLVANDIEREGPSRASVRGVRDVISVGSATSFPQREARLYPGLSND